MRLSVRINLFHWNKLRRVVEIFAALFLCLFNIQYMTFCPSCIIFFCSYLAETCSIECSYRCWLARCIIIKKYASLDFLNFADFNYFYFLHHLKLWTIHGLFGILLGTPYHKAGDVLIAAPVQLFQGDFCVYLLPLISEIIFLENTIATNVAQIGQLEISLMVFYEGTYYSMVAP